MKILAMSPSSLISVLELSLFLSRDRLSRHMVGPYELLSRLLRWSRPEVGEKLTERLTEYVTMQSEKALLVFMMIPHPNITSTHPSTLFPPQTLILTKIPTCNVTRSHKCKGLDSHGQQNWQLPARPQHSGQAIDCFPHQNVYSSCLFDSQHLLKIPPHATFLHTFDTGLGGTSARLIGNQYISLVDLYYGLMLPSGNDAAHILACYYGSWLLSNPFKSALVAQRRMNLSWDKAKLNLYEKKFVQFMNQAIVKEQLRHKITKFENPHGLSNKHQISTAWEVAEAALLFMQNGLFRTICSCWQYSGFYCDSQIEFSWTNTNLLLRQGYSGIKTGITNTAGGCLASTTSIQTGKYEWQDLLVVVLGCDSTDLRFTDTRLVVREYLRYLQMMRLS